MTVRRLLDEIDSRELTEWLAYDRVAPPSEGWQQSAQACVVMAQLWSKKPPKYEDFLPRPYRPLVPMTAREIRDRLSVLRA